MKLQYDFLCDFLIYQTATWYQRNGERAVSRCAGNEGHQDSFTQLVSTECLLQGLSSEQNKHASCPPQSLTSSGRQRQYSFLSNAYLITNTEEETSMAL